MTQLTIFDNDPLHWFRQLDQAARENWIFHNLDTGAVFDYVDRQRGRQGKPGTAVKLTPEQLELVKITYLSP